MADFLFQKSHCYIAPMHYAYLMANTPEAEVGKASFVQISGLSTDTTTTGPVTRQIARGGPENRLYIVGPNVGPQGDGKLAWLKVSQDRARYINGRLQFAAPPVRIGAPYTIDAPFAARPPFPVSEVANYRLLQSSAGESSQAGAAREEAALVAQFQAMHLQSSGGESSQAGAAREEAALAAQSQAMQMERDDTVVPQGSSPAPLAAVENAAVAQAPAARHWYFVAPPHIVGEEYFRRILSWDGDGHAGGICPDGVTRLISRKGDHITAAELTLIDGVWHITGPEIAVGIRA